MRLKNILLVVHDLEQSISFYKELFDMDVLVYFEGNVVLTGGLALQEQAQWETLTRQKTVYGGCDAELYFETYGLDSFIEKLENSMFPIESISRQTEHGERVLRFFDPDRHVIEVKEV